MARFWKNKFSHHTAGYIKCLCERHPQLMQDAFTEEECRDALQHIMHVVHVHHSSVTPTDQEPTEVLVGEAHVSQCAYKWIWEAFFKKNVVLAR